MNPLKRFLGGFDRLIGIVNESVGRAISFLLPIIAITVFCDVLMRKLFGRPIFWALEVNTYLLAGLIMLGGGYTLLHEGHVKVELLFNRLSPRGQALSNLVTYLLFFAFAGVMCWKGWEMAAHSFKIKEISPEATGIPIFIPKFVIPLGAALIFLQGMAKYGKDIKVLFTGKHPPENRGGE